MSKTCRTVYIGNESEIVEKKSRFITNIYPIVTEKEALQQIEEIRKKYWDASHNCFAYVIGNNYEIQRCSDDKEPNGTAGKPMLETLMGEEVKNVLAIVTRYFGGTLLGTGGLVRAYKRAVKEGLSGCTIVNKQEGIIYEVITDYTMLGKIQYVLGSMGITTLSNEYTNSVKIEIIIPIDEVPRLQEAVIQVTNGNVHFNKKEKQCFSLIDGKTILFS